MNIILIRHGETEDNVKKVFGTKGVGLTDKGKEQIKKIKTIFGGLQNGHIYISPLYRAVQTAELLGLSGSIEDRIREIDFGLFEGHTYKEIKNKFPEECKRWDDDYIAYITPGGESIETAYKRVISFLEELIKPRENAVLICHDGVIRIALCWVFDNLNYFFKFKIDNGSISIITIDDKGFKYITKANYTIDNATDHK